MNVNSQPRAEITTQRPFFAPGLCLTVVDIKFAVKQISQF
jgi:hypothetical protein